MQPHNLRCNIASVINRQKAVLLAYQESIRAFHAVSADEGSIPLGSTKSWNERRIDTKLDDPGVWVRPRRAPFNYTDSTSPRASAGMAGCSLYRTQATARRGAVR